MPLRVKTAKVRRRRMARKKARKRGQKVPRSRSVLNPSAMQQSAPMLTRAVVARRLGISVGGVRYHEGKALHPRQDADGVWRFDASEVEALASQLRDSSTIELSPGKLAARACQLFRDGKSVVDVVIALQQPFEVVQPLYRAFLDDTGGMHVPGPIVERMAVVCEVDKLTPELALQTLEENSRKLAALSGARHGGHFARRDPGDP